MSEEHTPEPENAAEPVEPKQKKPRKPQLKDWLRVMRSKGNGLPNTSTLLRINKANGLCTLVTNAPKQEGSDEMEGEHQQIFLIDSLDVYENDEEAIPGQKTQQPEAEEAGGEENTEEA